MEYKRLHRYISPEERFWCRVSRSSEDACWEWTGKLTSCGYGTLRLNNKGVAAHRFSYLLVHSVITPGLCVLHKCDNRKCVNPNHLYVGTTQQNSKDAVDRNRMAKGDRNGSRTHGEKRYRNWLKWRGSVPDLNKGESNGRAKLTAKDVLEIRKLYATGNYTKVVLAERFAVSDVIIGKVIRRELWAHVA